MLEGTLAADEEVACEHHTYGRLFMIYFEVDHPNILIWLLNVQTPTEFSGAQVFQFHKKDKVEHVPSTTKVFGFQKQFLRLI